jgi:hypothetical protein
MFGLFRKRLRAAVTATTDAEDRRRARRDRVLLKGKIVYGPGYTADCRIRDLTEAGARLMLDPDQTAPRDFHLIVVRDGFAYRAHRLWSKEMEAGVFFGESHDLAGPIPAHIQPIRKLWAQLAPRP